MKHVLIVEVVDPKASDPIINPEALAERVQKMTGATSVTVVDGSDRCKLCDRRTIPG